MVTLEPMCKRIFQSVHNGFPDFWERRLLVLLHESWLPGMHCRPMIIVHEKSNRGKEGFVGLWPKIERNQKDKGRLRIFRYDTWRVRGNLLAIEDWQGVVGLLVVVLHVLLLKVLPLALEGVLADVGCDGLGRDSRRTPLLMLFQTLLEALSKALQTG